MRSLELTDVCLLLAWLTYLLIKNEKEVFFALFYFLLAINFNVKALRSPIGC